MKSQIVQNVLKLMLGTSVLLVSVAFFIRTISPVQANSTEEIKLSENPNALSAAGSGPWIIGCGSGIYYVEWVEPNLLTGLKRAHYECTKIGPN